MKLSDVPTEKRYEGGNKGGNKAFRVIINNTNPNLVIIGYHTGIWHDIEKLQKKPSDNHPKKFAPTAAPTSPPDLYPFHYPNQTFSVITTTRNRKVEVNERPGSSSTWSSANKHGSNHHSFYKPTECVVPTVSTTAVIGALRVSPLSCVQRVPTSELEAVCVVQVLVSWTLYHQKLLTLC